MPLLQLTCYLQQILHQNTQSLANSYHFLPNFLPQIIIFHLDFYNYFFTGFSDSTLPNIQNLFSTRRQSCPFKLQAGSHPSFTLTSVVFPLFTQSKRQTCTVAYWGPNELTHLHLHSCHLLQLSPFHSNFGHPTVLDVSCTCQEYSHLGISYCATFSASDSFSTHNIWLHFSVYLAFWLCVI